MLLLSIYCHSAYSLILQWDEYKATKFDAHTIKFSRLRINNTYCNSFRKLKYSVLWAHDLFYKSTTAKHTSYYSTQLVRAHYNPAAETNHQRAIFKIPQTGLYPHYFWFSCVIRCKKCVSTISMCD